MIKDDNTIIKDDRKMIKDDKRWYRRWSKDDKIW